MPRFPVLRRVDAFVDYITEIEANDEREAAARANEDESRFEWKRRGVVQFDARRYVTLDADGVEMEGTEQRDF